MCEESTNLFQSSSENTQRVTEERSATADQTAPGRSSVGGAVPRSEMCDGGQSASARCGRQNSAGSRHIGGPDTDVTRGRSDCEEK